MAGLTKLFFIFFSIIAHGAHDDMREFFASAHQRIQTQTLQPKLARKVENVLTHAQKHPIVQRLNRILVNPDAWVTQARGISVLTASINHARFLGRFSHSLPLIVAALLQHITMPPIPHVTRSLLPDIFQSDRMRISSTSIIHLHGKMGERAWPYRQALHYDNNPPQPTTPNVLATLSLPSGHISTCKTLPTGTLSAISSYAFCTAQLIAHHQGWPLLSGQVHVLLPQPWHIFITDADVALWFADFRSLMQSQDIHNALSFFADNIKDPEIINPLRLDGIMGWEDERIIKRIFERNGKGRKQ